MNGRFSNRGITYLKKNFDELAIFTVLAKLAFGDVDGALSFDEETVVTALRRSSTKLADADIQTIGEYLCGYDEDQIPGIVNNVKGILHEFEFVEIENNDGDSIRAALFDETNHPGTDVLMFNEQTGEKWEVQLKATDNANYVEDWIHEHPDGEIMVTDELAHKLDLPSTEMSNSELTHRVDDVVDRLIELDDDSIWDYVPTLGVVSIAIIVYTLWQRYKNGEMDSLEFRRRACRASGLKAGKIVLLAWMLTVSGLSIAAGAYIAARLILTADSLSAKGFNIASEVATRSRQRFGSGQTV